ncbi:hypothetical protein J6590_104650 [Homalodisca vitripennis]|nr:hypothetical protein J6590_104650 [Homalodisca vitripennis]
MHIIHIFWLHILFLVHFQTTSNHTGELYFLRTKSSSSDIGVTFKNMKIKVYEISKKIKNLEKGPTVQRLLSNTDCELLRHVDTIVLLRRLSDLKSKPAVLDMRVSYR